MAFHSHREKLLWTAAGGFLAAIYAVLYPMPTVVDFLRDRHLLRATVVVAFVAAGALVAAAARRTRPGWREILAVGLFAPVYAFILVRMERAEEAFHFLEYGLIGALIYSALVERRRAKEAGRAAPDPAARPAGGGLRRRLAPLATAVAAALLTTAAGWLDEGIQYLLPNRYYDLRDVAFNAAAGAVAIAALALRAWARRRDMNESLRAGGGAPLPP